MSYVLVSLESEELVFAAALAQRLAELHPPARHFRGAAPPLQEVREELEKLPSPRLLVVVGHGGREGLGARRDLSTVWCDAAQLGEYFMGAKVYALACRTLETMPTLEALGDSAVAAGVACFLGHTAKIGLPRMVTSEEPSGIVRAEIERRREEWSASLARMLAAYGSCQRDRTKLLRELTPFYDKQFDDLNRGWEAAADHQHRFDFRRTLQVRPLPTPPPAKPPTERG